MENDYFRSKLLAFLKDNPKTTIKEICNSLECSRQKFSSNLYHIRSAGYEVEVIRNVGTVFFRGLDSAHAIPQIIAVLEKMEMTRKEIKTLYTKLTGLKGVSFVYILNNIKQSVGIKARWGMVGGKEIECFSIEKSKPKPHPISKKREQEIRAEYERTKPARMPLGVSDHNLMRDSVLAVQKMKRYGLLTSAK